MELLKNSVRSVQARLTRAMDEAITCAQSRKHFFDNNLRAIVADVGQVARAMTYDEGDPKKLAEAVTMALGTVMRCHMALTQRMGSPRQIQADIRAEADRAIVKHGFDQTPAGRMPHTQRLIIVMEELGEVADATLDQTDDNLITECVQLGAMLAMWASAL